MPEEEKGFIIKDRRSLDEDGTLKEEKETKRADQQTGQQQEAERGEEGRRKETARAPLPEVNFNSLIFSLSSSALLHLGEIADPQSGQEKKDLDLAKHTIDTIAMLKDKTKGNLTGEEQKFLESVLTDLRWRYVKAVG
ncbi:MAG: DUF1844 domain-containing protein [Deltaproteobacteria bacterium]|nr:DUF1844 domain-containing protein [Deltaproteobacteria bacterium]MBW2137929.1 DUF1844 domain-containing protein [Deltaproteobacteria bacterium]